MSQKDVQMLQKLDWLIDVFRGQDGLFILILQHSIEHIFTVMTWHLENLNIGKFDLFVDFFVWHRILDLAHIQ